ncbi:hypothetical protein CesoFtcFv8_012273 [Champsocephalus esox]|uniref:Uncharacterized protein n=1 Tax=Champsocephalus esox TaxID=159716 RepID=A0AAN8BUL2_9TELE|nr:hypothetical protein CesoFtcFv8_012273 [Champsocephalus esox]
MCLPYGETVTSEVHNWDPDTEEEEESEGKEGGRRFGDVDGEERQKMRGRGGLKLKEQTDKAASQGTERRRKMEERADGKKEVRGSTAL